MLQLAGAGRIPEIRRRPADIVDIAFEAGVFRHGHRLGQHRFFAAAGHLPALMGGNGAEVARAETSPVVHDGKFYFLNGGYAAFFFIRRVIVTGKGQRPHPV